MNLRLPQVGRINQGEEEYEYGNPWAGGHEKDELPVEKQFKDDLGKKMYNNLLLENAQETFQALTQLQLFHLITNYISHRVKQEQQARYQIAASKLFKL